jgi:hypothetical protein
MKLNRSKCSMVILGVVVFLVVGTIVWASPPASPPTAPPQASPGFDADMVDGHHAAASWWPSPLSRAWKVLWATGDGTLHPYALPQPWLNAYYARRVWPSQLAVNPLEIEGTSEILDSGFLRFEHHWTGYANIWTTDTVSPFQGTAWVPVHNPTRLFGTPLRLMSIEVCHKVASGSYIDRTTVYYADTTGDRTELLDDATDRTSTSWDCYSATDSTPGLVDGPLFVWFNLKFGGTGSSTSNNISIGRIVVTLMK